MLYQIPDLTLQSTMTGLGIWWEGSYHQNPPNKISPRVFFQRSHPPTGYQVHIHIEEMLSTYCMKEFQIPKHCIAEQLMFLPPAGVLPADPLDPAAPLKKILLWNGASSWGGIRSVRVRVIGTAMNVTRMMMILTRIMCKHWK